MFQWTPDTFRAVQAKEQEASRLAEALDEAARAAAQGLEQEARRAARKSVAIRAQLRPPGSDRLAVEVKDLSETGFQIETVYRLTVGSTVWLAIPSLAPLEAMVAWHRDRHYGCRFHRALYPAVFDHIVSLAGR
ncbi:PilZ domain-containing protein [Sphingomonas sp. AR_OL41]|uniref:PilZ domain-containing protein n=1 Tax=Sphingomonas sp. AR_OL41 TaxID=3042729 RepID=UPI002480BDF9|nr:PilZ domain-containing protein [Sphingomonas sp. AR_OL41]MDH7974988.1 PilZ domain-containing protein [Sphingomonas sp. AR_OL41]